MRVFLQENRIKISQNLKMTTKYLKSNSRMYEMIMSGILL